MAIYRDASRDHHTKHRNRRLVLVPYMQALRRDPRGEARLNAYSGLPWSALRPSLKQATRYATIYPLFLPRRPRMTFVATATNSDKGLDDFPKPRVPRPRSIANPL